MNLAVIPARIGSKGLPEKNIQPLYGKPLIHHTIDEAIKCPFIDTIVVTTDSYKIASLCQPKCHVHIRPNNLGKDATTLAPVIIDAVESYPETTNVFTLQPTSPLRTHKHIEEAYNKFKNKKADSLISVREELHSLWGLEDGQVVKLYQPTSNRQWTMPYYIGNGAIFITKKKILFKKKNRTGGKITFYLMDEESSLDIHTIKDLELAEWYMRKRL